LIAFAAVLGLFYGGWVAVLPSVVMDRFGGRNVSAVIGVLYTSVAFGTLIGPTVAGFLFDMTSSYLWPILAAVAANLAAALITSR
jgi:MFS family permease